MKFYLCAFFVLSLLSSESAFCIEKREFELENGSRVLLVKNTEVPVAVLAVGYGVGSFEDSEANLGIAHFVEHLMFRTVDESGKPFTESLKEMNANYNAYTSFDKTVYFSEVKLGDLENLIRLDAKRMSRIDFGGEEFEAEKKVVLAELAQRDSSDDKLQRLQHKSLEVLFKRNRMGTPVIGFVDKIVSTTKDDILDFHSKYYTPDNSVIVVTGGIDLDYTESLIRKYYSPIRKKDYFSENGRRYVDEYPEDMEHRIYIKGVKNIKGINMLSRVYASKDKLSGDKETIALYALSFILGGGYDSLLHRKLLIDKNIVSYIDCDFFYDYMGTFIFGIDTVPSADVSLDDVSYEIDSALSKDSVDNFNYFSIEEIRKHIKNRYLISQENPVSLANICAERMLEFGIPSEETIESISMEDINNVFYNKFKVSFLESHLIEEDEKNN